MTGRTSWNGRKKIYTYEAFVTVPYLDGHHPDGTPKYSQGFGSQLPVPVPGSRITIEEGFIRAGLHIDGNDAVMRRLLPESLPQHQWDAIASIFYQAGISELRQVVGWVNDGLDFRYIATRWLDFDCEIDKDTGEKIRRLGLAKRRQSERLLAIFGDYGDIHQYKYFDGDPHKVLPTMKDFPAEEPRPT